MYKNNKKTPAKRLIFLSITETSMQMGFENPFHFSRLFKKNEGVCPSMFKKQIEQLALKRF